MRLLRIPEVLSRTGLTRTRLYAEIDAGRFPKPVKITAGARAVAFLETELDDWLAERVAERDVA